MADLHSVTHEGVELSSYSETPEQLRASFGLEQQSVEKPVETPTPDELVSAEPQPGEPPAESAAGQTLAKKRRSLQDRIDAITREKYETARERDEARSQARRLEQELAELRRTGQPSNGHGHTERPLTPAAPAPADKFPKYAEYLQTHPDAELEEYMDARDEWKEQRRAEQTRTREQTELRTRTLAQRTQTFSAKMATAVQHDPDLLSKVDSRLLQTKPLSGLAPDESPTFGNFLVEQVLASEHPEKLLLHLSDAKEVERLAALDPDRVIRELAKVEYGLGAAPSGPAPPPVRQSQAKPPVKPLGGSPQVDADAPPGDDADDETHRLYWNQKELARRRRG